MALWDLVVNLTYIASFILMPVVVSSNLSFYPYLYFEEGLIDIILLINLILNFFKIKPTMKNDIKFREIANDFLEGWFLLDALGCIPSLVTVGLNDSFYYFKLFRYFQV